MVSLGIEGFEYGTVQVGRSTYWRAEESSMYDGPLGVWRSWADEGDGGPIRCGHFIPEEAADELSASLIRFLATS